MLVAAWAPSGANCDYASVAEAAVRAKDGSISLDGAVTRVIEDFEETKIVTIKFAPDEKHGGAGVAIRRSDCVAVDVAIGGVWSGE